MFLLCLSQVVRQVDGVGLVDVCRDLVEAGDEGVLDPVHEELRAQHEETIGGQLQEHF